MNVELTKGEALWILDAVTTFEDRARQALFFRPDLTNAGAIEDVTNTLKEKLKKALKEAKQ